MLLHNEIAEDAEDLEHFEDITENEEKGAIRAPNNTYNKDLVADPKDGSGSDSDSSIDEGGSFTFDSEEDDLKKDELLGNKDFYKLEELKSINEEGINDIKGQTLPGGYDPRLREPSYCNADRSGWWELTVLASHVHPSVAVMARTLLSGVNIVYDGNPLRDLALGAFLDKFMEKKPKPIKWRGTSQIEPAKKVPMNHQLIGAEILSMAEEDVPPEDVVFHKFYMNKINSSKKPKKKKKKKKTTEDEADEEIYAVDGDGDGDESENEEIDNLLGSVDDSSVESEEGDYDYNDLDKIADKDDEDLIDEEVMEFPSDVADDEFEDEEVSSKENSDDDIAIGEADDGHDFEKSFELTGKKKKTRKVHTAASPYASLEDYEHLMEDDDHESEEKVLKKNCKSRKKKRRMS